LFSFSSLKEAVLCAALFDLKRGRLRLPKETTPGYLRRGVVLF
jgi:hypothetical protein